jgi:ferredoxin-NADP reductase
MDHDRYRRSHGHSAASMKKASFDLSLKGKTQIATGTREFDFEKPEGFRFKAGQHLRMTLINPPETDREGDSRFLSVASTPQDPDLMVAMRMRDTAFKRVLERMPIGGRVLVQILLDVPHGAFALHDDPSRAAVFLVGGIGIAPAFSMIKDALQRKLPHRLFLFYSNRTPEDAPYLQELQKLAEQNPSLTLVATMTGDVDRTSACAGETGRIDRSMIAKHVGDLSSPVYYISGLPEMTSAMRTILADSGVGKASIQAEEFTGFNLNEKHGGAAGAWKRPAVLMAIGLPVAAAVVLHAGVGLAIFHNGFDRVSSVKPAWYVLIGILLVLGMIKIRYFAGLHRSGGRLARLVGGHSGHAPPSPTKKTRA